MNNMKDTHQLIQELIQALENGPCPSTRQLIDLSYALHGAMCAADLPELLWMHVTLEDAADAIVSAHKLVESGEEEAAHGIRQFTDDDTDRLRELREAGL